MRTIAIGALVLFAVSGAAGGVSPHGLITGNAVRVRSGPHKSFREMCELDKGTVVTILGVSDNGKWLRIAAPEDGNVWIFGKYVDVAGGRGVVNGDRVRVRIRPNGKGEVVNKLNHGAAVKIKGRKEGWLRIVPPKNTVAWVSAGDVQRMTAGEFRALTEQEATEAARKARQEAKADRRRREARMVAKADELLVAELDKELADRSLAEPLCSYQNAQKQVKDAELLRSVERRIALILAMQDVQSALAKKTAPRPLPKIDFSRVVAGLNVQKPVGEHLLAAHRRAEQVAEQARQGAARRQGAENEFEGWLTYLDPALKRTGATYKITKARRVLALVKSGRVNLASFVGMRVQIVGTSSGHVRLSPGADEIGIVDVAHLRPAFE